MRRRHARYLSERNALPDRPLVALAPVNIRDDEDADAGNIIGGAVCTLATDLDDPAERLQTIHMSMRRNVEIIRQLPRQVAIHLFGVLCAPISSDTGLGARIPPVFNVGISHMRGLDTPLYRNGARLEATYPLPPTLRGQALNVGLFCSGETIDFGLVSSERAVPDLERMRRTTSKRRCRNWSERSACEQGIAVSAVSKSFGDVIALRDISFEVGAARSSGFSDRMAQARRRWSTSCRP